MKDLELGENETRDERSTASKLQVTNVTVKMFPKVLKKKPTSSFQVFQDVSKGRYKKSGSENVKGSRLRQMLDKLKSVFVSE